MNTEDSNPQIVLKKPKWSRNLLIDVGALGQDPLIQCLEVFVIIYIYIYILLETTENSGKDRERNRDKERLDRGATTDKSKLFWDGFQWVTRTTPLITSFEQTITTKKVQVSNLPLELGLTAHDVINFLNAAIQERINDKKEIIQNVKLIPAQNSADVELFSKDDIDKIKSIDGN